MQAGVGAFEWFLIRSIPKCLSINMTSSSAHSQAISYSQPQGMKMCQLTMVKSQLRHRPTLVNKTDNVSKRHQYLQYIVSDSPVSSRFSLRNSIYFLHDIGHYHYLAADMAIFTPLIRRPDKGCTTSTGYTEAIRPYIAL